MPALVDPAALRAAFTARGYVHLRGHYDAAEIDALAAELRRLASLRADADVLDVGGLKFHAGLLGRSPFLQALLSAPKALAPLCAIAGPDLWVRWDQAVEKRPGAGMFPWHQDNSYSGLVDPHFQYWVSLTRMTADNGGLWLIPGSHARRLPHGRDGAHTVHEPSAGTPELVAARRRTRPMRAAGRTSPSTCAPATSIRSCRRRTSSPRAPARRPRSRSRRIRRRAPCATASSTRARGGAARRGASSTRAAKRDRQAGDHFRVQVCVCASDSTPPAVLTTRTATRRS
jgi:hypothetical protein